MKRVLITGAHGMLGQDIARVLSDQDVVLYDKAELDITDREAVHKSIAQVRPDVVINTAAYNLVDNAQDDRFFPLACSVNSNGPRNLAQVCVAQDVRLVHYSSDYVFFGDKKEGYTEYDTPNPCSRYGESKYAGEQAVRQINPEAIIIRTCRLFGKPGIGEVVKKSFVDVMLGLAQEKKELTVVNAEVASPTYSLDLAHATRSLLDDADASGIYHITNSGSCTWYEFAQEIFRQKQIDIVVHPVPASAFPRPAQRPQYSVLLSTRIPTLRHWKESLRDYLLSDG